MHFLDALIAAGVKNIVFSSTCAVYGDPETIPITETETKKPVNPYGETKLFVERMLHWYGIAHGLKWVAPRYFNAAGADPEGEIGELHEPETHLIPAAFEAVQGKRPQLKSTARTIRLPTEPPFAITSTCSIWAARIFSRWTICARAGNRSSVNLGTGVGQSVLDVVAAVRAATGREVPHVLRPRRAGDPPELVADPSSPRDVLGWTAEFRDIQRIVETAWAWHRQIRKSAVI